MTEKPDLTLNNFTIQSQGFEAEVIRTNRKKTIAFKIAEGKVSILVPKSLAAKEISSLILKKQRWINEKLELQKASPTIKPKAFVAEEIFSYLGNDVRLKIVAGAYPKIQFDQQNLIVSVRNPTLDNATAIKQLLIKWYQQQAYIALSEKTQYYAKIIGVSPTNICIKTYKARWGSCSTRGEIYYNWKIMMAPVNIIDYLVVHELCHILHHNHSPSFWLAVEKYHPEFRTAKAWLKANGRSLEI